MAFSGALTLTDLNDFITPSQACIKPVEQSNKPEPKDPGAASTEIRVDSGGSYYEVSTDGFKKVDTKKKLETAEISLNDCLACSGCITSAESVLITLQSHTEVLNFLFQNPPPTSVGHTVTVISIAPQTLASLAASISSSSNATPVTLHQILQRVRVFCKTVLGFDYVYDTTFARHIALLEHAQEFRERKNGSGALPMLASACPGWVCYAEKTHAEMLPFISRTKSPQQVMGTLVKEWFAKKWHKSPDQIYHVSVMPCYDKKLEASRQDFYNETYATRDVDCVITTGELELMMREKGWDLSISVDGEDNTGNSNDQLSLPRDGGGDEDNLYIPELINHPGTSSGSYLHSLISLLVNDSSTSIEKNPLDLSVRSIRSADYEEYTLTERATGTVIFRGAKCYGFRNLQNVVRKVGREAGVQVGRGAAGRLGGVRGRGVRVKKTTTAGDGVGTEKGYDYVEVMACPGGCVNGGGQLRPPAPPVASDRDAEGYKRDWEVDGVKIGDEDGGRIQGQGGKWGDREWTKKVEETYWAGVPAQSSDVTSCVVDSKALHADKMAGRVLRDTCDPHSSSNLSWSATLEEPAEARRRKLFRTQYRAVESEVIGLAVKW
ncbi:iron hydrogenase [Abortiporus biennis]|nr:iron hydrogenase [Abortiporus biennis]